MGNMATGGTSQASDTVVSMIADHGFDRAISDVDTHFCMGCKLLASPKATDFDSLFFHECLKELSEVHDKLKNKAFRTFTFQYLNELFRRDTTEYYSVLRQWSRDVEQEFKPIIDKILTRFGTV
jgi:hypothetical protein